MIVSKREMMRVSTREKSYEGRRNVFILLVVMQFGLNCYFSRFLMYVQVLLRFFTTDMIIEWFGFSFAARKEKERKVETFVDPYGHINRQALFVLVECIYNYSKEKTTEMIVQS